MFGRNLLRALARARAAAAIVVAFIVFAGCGGDDPMGPSDNGQSAVLADILDFTVKGTEVEFSIAVLDAVNPVLEWFEDGLLLCVGNPCRVMLAVGEHTITVRMTDENGSDEGSFTVTVLAADIIIESILPADGSRLTYGEPLPCLVNFHYDPGPTLESVSVWEFEGGIAGCDQILDPGTYNLKLTVKSLDGSHEVVIFLTFEVVFPPGEEIVFSVLTGRDTREFFSATLGDVSSLAQLTNSGGNKTWPIFSADRSKFAYTLEGSECWEVFVVDPDFSNPMNVSGENCASRNTRAPYFSPEGSQLIYTGNWVPPNLVSSELAVFVVDADGSNRRRLPTRTCVEGFGPAPCFINTGFTSVFHPNGKDVVLVSQEILHGDDSAHNVIVRFNVDTGDSIRLLSTPNNIRVLEVSDVSSDGDWIVAHTFDSNRIMIVRTNGSGEFHLLTTSQDGGYWPFFCYGERYICYVPVNNPRAILRVDLDGNNLEQVFFISFGAIETPRVF